MRLRMPRFLLALVLVLASLAGPARADDTAALLVNARLLEKAQAENASLRLSLQETRADRDRRDLALAAQAGAWKLEVDRVHQQSLVAWGLTVVGTGALAAGLVAIADGHRTAGALVAAGGTALGIGGLVLARF